VFVQLLLLVKDVGGEGGEMLHPFAATAMVDRLLPRRELDTGRRT
jgi:hypothetical protein